MRRVSMIDIWLITITAAMMVFSTFHFLRYLYLLTPRLLPRLLFASPDLLLTWPANLQAA